MSNDKTRYIPGTTSMGYTRGGGTENVKWIRNGAFLMTRSVDRFTPAPALGIDAGSGLGYTYIAPNWNGGGFLPGSPTEESEIRSKGAFAMNATRPGRPAVNLLTTAGELVLDQAPLPEELSVWKEKTRFFKNLANHHLLVQFGWLPLLADIQGFLKDVVHGDNAIKRAAGQSGGDTHVGIKFRPELASVSFTEIGYPALRYDGITFAYAQLAVTTTKVVEKKTWFEGTWTSFFPGYPEAIAANQKNMSSMAARFLNVAKPTPKMVWDLAPWSWAVDWCTGFGQSLEIASNLIDDGQVLRNAFVMNHWKNATLVEFKGANYNNPYNQVGSGSVETLFEVKTRFPSAPYFGFASAGEFTPRQLSILAALGISKSPG